MGLIILAACIFACGIAIYLIVWRVEARALRVRRTAARAVLAETRLTVDGDVLTEFTLKGCSRDVDVRLSSDVEVSIPGPSGRRRRVCLVEVAVESRDLVVCRKADTDQIMGALPQLPRVLTVDRSFDEQYAVFVSESEGPAPAAPGYRTGPAALLPWARPEMLRTLSDLRLVWLRIREGKCELALEPIDDGNAAAAILLGVNLVRAATGRSLAVLPHVRAAGPKQTSVLPLHLVLSVSLAGLTFSFVVPLLAQLPFVRGLASESVCGADQLVSADFRLTGRGDLFTATCSDGRNVSSSYYLQCTILHVALVFLVLGALALVRQRRAAAAPNQRGASDVQGSG